jgi:predicted acyltransferase (DUF342 family)
MSSIQEIRRGSTAKLNRVDGELKVGNKARIEASNGDLVVVSQSAYFEGAGEIDCDFECDSLSVQHGGALKVNGDLVVHKLLDVVHSIDATGSIKAGEIDVGGKIKAKSIECHGRIRVGRVLEVQETIEAESVDVGGKATAGGTVKLQDLRVGEVAEVAGGAILGEIRVGGRFESSARLEFGDLQVFGMISLPDGCKGKKISTYGRLSAAGDIECGELEIKGCMDVQGNCKSERIDSGGKFVVRGSLEVSRELDAWGSTEVSGDFSGADLRIGGNFKARRAIVSDEAELVGEAETKEGLKANVILVRSGSKCKGSLVGENVEIGKSDDVVSNWERKWAGQRVTFRLIRRETRVEDIYAKEVHLGRASRCGKVFAEVVEFEEGCIVEEISYTKEVRGPIEKAFITQPVPKKVAELPNPPL